MQMDAWRNPSRMTPAPSLSRDTTTYSPGTTRQLASNRRVLLSFCNVNGINNWSRFNDNALQLHAISHFCRLYEYQGA